MQSIILIGYRCTGKTGTAKKIAARLNLPVYDSDSIIQQKINRSIADIFAQDGEEAFRDIEENVIDEIVQKSPPPFILSTGGGAVLREKNRWRLHNAGAVFWLKAEPETILNRLEKDKKNKTQRPSLTNLPALEEIETLLKKRNPLYAETAHETVDTDDRSASEIIKTILGKLAP
ncbi:shikimate kinase [Planctomycetales bacterium]|nr:shikimate kinase [Planctomycetales bacterium]